MEIDRDGDRTVLRTWTTSGANADMDDLSFEVVFPSDFENQNQKSLEKTMLKRKPNEKKPM